jgi:uncharacterized protein
MKKTLIIGASTNPERYAYKAAHSLVAQAYMIELVGNKSAQLLGHTIHTNKPVFDNIDTVTLYIGQKNQPEYYNYIIGLQPRRVIFNPGTENHDFEQLLIKNNIEPLEACTLVMLSVGTY